MISKEIEATLAKLKAESANINKVDTESVDAINQLINKLENQLSQPEIIDHKNILMHLKSTIQRFEVSHPRITSITNDLMVKLAGMGL